jgi:hypothetical protein
MPKGMAIRTVTISEAPISRTVGHILSTIIELTDVFCLKLVPKSPWRTMSLTQMPYWMGRG